LKKKNKKYKAKDEDKESRSSEDEDEEDLDSDDEDEEDEEEEEWDDDGMVLDLRGFEPTNAFLIEYINNCTSDNTNVLRDLGAATKTLLDFDGLLLYCIEDSLLDFEEHSGQFLHLTYLVERFLKELQLRLVNFSLFSFSAYDGYYKSNPSHLVAKRMLTKHLAKNCALEITSIRTREDYEQHLIITNPICVYLYDGLNCLFYGDIADLERVEKLQLATIFTTLSSGFPVAFYQGSSFITSGIISRVIEIGEKLPSQTLSYLFNIAEGEPVTQENFEDFKLFFQKNYSHTHQVITNYLNENRNSFPQLNLQRLTFNVLGCQYLLSKEKNLENLDSFLIFILFKSLFLLEILPLQKRRFRLSSNLDRYSQRSIPQILKDYHFLLGNTLADDELYVDQMKETNFGSLLFDPFDGRLFFKVFETYLKQARKSKKSKKLEGVIQFPQDIQPLFSCLWNCITNNLSNDFDLWMNSPLLIQRLIDLFPTPTLNNSGSKFRDILLRNQVKVFPIYDKGIADFFKNKEEEEKEEKEALFPTYTKEEVNDHFISRKRFEETHHWHSARPITDPHFSKLEKSNGWMEQKLATYFAKKARTMNVTSKLITLGQKQSQPKGRTITSKQALEYLKNDILSWKKYSPLSHYQKAKANGIKIQPSPENEIKRDCIILIETLHEMYKVERDRFDDLEVVDLERKILLFCRYLMTFEPSFLTSTNVKRSVYHLLSQLGFQESAKKLYENGKEPKPKNSIATKPRCLIEFQLKQLSSSLFPIDDKAKGFVPEPWQKNLYQVVNENKSALVIAPTSAGKTFISFYCMEKIICQSNEDVVVYVAPTKAIGNQVRADVYARFTKKYKHNNVRLTGVFTRDLRVDPLDCQILITVPEAFKILLTAPSTMKWRKKIKYVIFDEIHSISSSDGIVWEQLLISIRCPFLGLSATIGNSDDFAGWLRKILAKKGEQDGVKYELDVISHSERYSHLEYNLLQVPILDSMTKDEALKLTKLNNQTDLLPKYYKEKTKKFFNYQHPLSFVGFDSIQFNKLPPDFRMSPKACIFLYEAMMEVIRMKDIFPSNAVQQQIKSELEEFSIQKYFETETHEKIWITKRSAFRYEKSILEFLIKCASSPKTVKFARSVVQRLTPQSQFNDSIEPNQDIDTLLMGNIFDIACAMCANQKLPALFFSFSRRMCEDLAMLLLQELEELEELVSEIRERMEMENAFQKVKFKEDSQQEKGNKKSKKKSVEDDEREDLPSLQRIYPFFTFIPRKSEQPEEDMDDVFKDLEKGGMSRDHILVRALRYGIGVHHAGMPTKYRQHVEQLFSLGFFFFFHFFFFFLFSK